MKQDFHDYLGKIKNKEDFLEFMNLFAEEQEGELKEYLTSVQAWAEDMEGYYKNTNQALPPGINWDFIAVLLYAGTIYE